MPLPRSVARFNRRATNRLTGLVAGRVPGFGMLTHVGRRSGRTYHTPINVFRDGNEYIIVLTYGPETDWLRNIMAAGGADLLTRGRVVHLTNPRLVTDPNMRFVPQPVRWLPQLAGVTQYLRLTPTADSGATTRDHVWYGEAPSPEERPTEGSAYHARGANPDDRSGAR